MFIWPIQEETDTKNATLCEREKIKMGKVELSITVLNKILNNCLHNCKPTPNFEAFVVPKIVLKPLTKQSRINNMPRCLHLGTSNTKYYTT